MVFSFDRGDPGLSVGSSLGQGLGKGFSEQFPKEFERFSLSKGLDSLKGAISEQALSGTPMTDLDMQQNLLAIRGMTPEKLQALYPVVREYSELQRRSQENARNSKLNSYPRTEKEDQTYDLSYLHFSSF